MGQQEKPISIGDIVDFTPDKWRKIGDLAGAKKVIAINIHHAEPFYLLECGNVKVEATRFEIKKHEQ